MQGCKQFEPRLFSQISLNDLVPRNHLVRRLAEALDFSWIRSATSRLYSNTGRPSIDPEVVAKLLLLGYLYNIASERRLMREVQVNLAYRWYLGYDLDEEIPDHSILSKARHRLGADFFEQLFEFTLGCCQEADLVRRENEGLFGQAKSQHGLDRARLRGLAKMHIQGLLTAMVLNEKKFLQTIIRIGVVAQSVGLEPAGNSFEFILVRLFGLCYGEFALRNERIIFFMLSKW